METYGLSRDQLLEIIFFITPVIPQPVGVGEQVMDRERPIDLDAAERREEFVHRIKLDSQPRQPIMHRHDKIRLDQPHDLSSFRRF